MEELGAMEEQGGRTRWETRIRASWRTELGAEVENGMWWRNRTERALFGTCVRTLPTLFSFFRVMRVEASASGHAASAGRPGTSNTVLHMCYIYIGHVTCNKSVPNLYFRHVIFTLDMYI